MSNDQLEDFHCLMPSGILQTYFRPQHVWTYKCRHSGRLIVVVLHFGFQYQSNQIMMDSFVYDAHLMIFRQEITIFNKQYKFRDLDILEYLDTESQVMILLLNNDMFVKINL